MFLNLSFTRVLPYLVIGGLSAVYRSEKLVWEMHVKTERVRNMQGQREWSIELKEQATSWMIKASLEDEVRTDRSVNKLKLRTHSGDHSSTVLIVFLYQPYVCDNPEALAFN